VREWLGRAAGERPAHPALIAEGREVSYAELDAAASRTARRLAARGVGPGDRVATTLPPGPAFAELLHALPRLGAVLVPLNPADPVRTDAVLTVTGPLEGEEADVALREVVDPDTVHTVIHTSGTSGRPKAVELSYGNHHASALASADNLGSQPDDRWLGVLPLFHAGGLAVLIRSAIYATTAVLHERFEPETVRGSLEAGEVTLASFVPTMLARLRAAGLERAPRLRAALLGGGPVPGELLDWAVSAGLPACPTYGMTETASQIVTARPGERSGRPLRGVELRIGADGEILVRGPIVARGSLAPDGWLHTGDRGRIDEQGRLHVEGRLKEIIVTGGENVSPEEVEEALLAHPAVRDAGVAGLPDPEWGEAVTAFVVLRDDVDAAALGEWSRGRLAPHKVPKRIVVVAELPRNAAGKLLRGRLGAGRGSIRVRRS
jgi:o-succinylbenzoate---CoA ligase